MVSLAGLTNSIILTFFIILLLSYFFGQNWRGWYAARQVRKSVRKIKLWRNYGINIIKNEIEPFLPSSISAIEAESFIQKMIEFFVIAPTQLDPPIFNKLRFLIYQKEKRYKQLIKDFLPEINDSALLTITSLIQATSALNDMAKDMNHNLILGKKTHSSFHIQKTASKIQRTMLKAESFRIALDSFRLNEPIGDSIGPMAIMSFIHDNCLSANLEFPNPNELDCGFVEYEFPYKGRHCICLRAKGPNTNVGSPGLVLEHIFKNNPTNYSNVSLIITIDARQKLEGEKAGMVNQGIGTSIGGEGEFFIDKYQIETLALENNPKIPIESIAVKESFEDAVSPLTEEIKNSITDILRILKKIIRSQAKKGERVIILGIGNALGVKNTG